MPTYHYRCSGCDQHLEVVQSMTDEPLTECGACGGEMYKVLRPVGIVLKGSGFYRTDNRSTAKAGKGEAKTDSKADSKADSKSDKKSDKKSGSSDSTSSTSTSTKSAEAKSA